MDLETIKKRIFKNIVVEGFDVDKNGYSFVKKTSKIRCEVGFSVREDYLVIENEVIDFVKAYCFWASIAYPEMENILHPILVKNELFGDIPTDKTEREELSEILGQFAPMKKAVILKLCNDSNYQEFMDSYFQKQKEYFDEDPEDIDNIRYYNASKELKQVLDNTKPIYNV